MAFSLGWQQLLLMTPGLLAAITFHEWAHAQAADTMGDPTARLAGRLTLNPIAHIDVVGLLLLVVAGFGWAKPVPIEPRNFRDQRQGLLWVSLAGPLMNLLLAYSSLVIMQAAAAPRLSALWWVLQFSAQFNVILFIFNLLPIPPLDGSKILAALVPRWGRAIMYHLESMGWILLLVLIFTGAISWLLGSAVGGIMEFLNLAAMPLAEVMQILLP